LIKQTGLFQKIKDLSQTDHKLGFVSEVDKLVSTKFKNPRIVQQFLEILEKEGIETHEEWNNLSEEQKKKFPVGLKNFLDGINSKTTEIEEIVLNEFKYPTTSVQRFKNILNENSSNTSLISVILKDYYEKEAKLEFLEEDLKLLQKQRVINLRDWNNLSEEQKKKYPDGLKNFLDDLNTKTTES
jgi:hypothetical protein